MKAFKKNIRNTPVIREILLFALRCKLVFVYLARLFKKTVVWLFTSREYTNFTYDLTELNKRYLASLLAGVTGQDFQKILLYIAELENDSALRSHIVSAMQNNSEHHFGDMKIYYGRRLGWYVLARVTRPKFVIETGVDKGLGSCVLTAALMKNEQEGFPGYYYGVDINPAAGYLLSGEYKKHGEILYGDSIETLKNLNVDINLFVNDSDHSAEYEEKEYETILNKLDQFAIILGDNSHVTTKLIDFALATDRQFVFFHESPLNHWYPGAGIGIAYRRKG